MTPVSIPAPERRHDLDALRVGAFGLLILYHLGMFYVPWGWHVKSAHIVPALEPVMGSVNPWRLTLLFVISGAATRFMAAKTATRTLAASRSQRLLIPLLFGMLVIVAPQSWAEVVEKHGYEGGFFQFWLTRYLAFDQSFGIILPTYNHLWFVAYLWVYTLAAIAARPLAPVADRWAKILLAGPGLFLTPILVFGLIRATAFPVYGESHIIFNDVYGHLHYAAAFVIGLVLARRDEAWSRLLRHRYALLIAALVNLAVAHALNDLYEEKPGLAGFAFAFLRQAYAWIAICALFGLARRWITRGSPLLSRLSEAVFPAYIIHQTTIVLAGHLMKPLGLTLWAEAAILLLLTALSCGLAYAVALTVPGARMLLGVKPKA